MNLKRIIFYFKSLIINYLFLIVYLIDSLIFMLAYNWAIPMLNVDITWIPTTLNYVTTYSIFVIIHYLGVFISKIIPKFK